MDEELMNQTVEEYDVTEDIEVQEIDVPVEDVEQEIPVSEIVYDVTIVPEEEVEIDISESIGWIPGDATMHYSLAGRDEPNQHEIKSITGLRAELDELERLKTVYADKTNVANYYEWHDASYDEHGYFVNLVPGTTTIEICGGPGIFGVTVDSAAFIGGQDENIPRDNAYGLVVTSGLVDVRCELDVEVGDYVVSNAYGYAEKADSTYGYKVLARENKHGVEYAVILLGVQADVTDALGVSMHHLEDRIGAAETNIVSAINVAQQAYDKATDIGRSNSEMSDKVDGALSTVDKITNDVANMGTQVNQAVRVSASARAIADGAVASAEKYRQEAIESANNSLAETAKLREEFEDRIAEIDAELDDTASKLDDTKQSLNTTKTELQGSIDDAVQDLEELEKDLEPLATWPDTENPTGIAGFVARADEDSVTLGGLVKWQGETNESIAAFKQEVAENYATQEMVTAVGDNLTIFQQEVADNYATQEMVTNVDNALTGYKQEVAKNYATQQMLSAVEDNLVSYKQEVTDIYATQQMVTAVSDNLTSYKQEVSDTYATQEMVTKLETDTSKALADYKQEVKDGYATQEMVTTLQTDTSKALSDYKQEVTDTYATQTSLSTLRTDTTNAIAASEEKATNTYASKTDLTSFESETNSSLASITQKADANGASIQMTVSNMDKYSVGPHSQAYGFNREQAENVLEEGMIYVPIADGVTETYQASGEFPAYTRRFSKHYLYKWGKIADGYCGWITVDKNHNSTSEINTSAQSVYFTPSTPAVGDNYGYWYTTGTPTNSAYKAQTLYKWMNYNTTDADGKDVERYQWVAVATLAGNSSNRAVSQIRQDANSIELRVTDTEGSYAGLKSELTDTQSDLQALTSWTKDKDGNQYNLATIKQTADGAGASIAQVVEAVGDEDGKVTSASIITAINNDESAVVISADKVDIKAQEVDLTGYVKFNDLQDSGKQTVINGDYITTGTLDADKVSVINLDASNITTGTLDAGKITVTNIDASQIATGILQSNGYKKEDQNARYSETGTSFNLNNGSITSEQFAIDGDGNAYFRGKITVEALPDEAAIKSDIPKNTSELVNDSGYQNAAEVTTIADNSIKTATIEADQITTGTLKSKGYNNEDSNTIYSEAGTCFDLDSGAITSKQFAITSDGKAYFNGIVGDDFSIAASNITFTSSGVRGRNLLAGTATPLTIAAGTSDYKFEILTPTETPLTKGQKYTLSANIEVAQGSAEEVRVILCDKNLSTPYDTSIGVLIEDGRIVVTMIPTTDAAERVLIYAGKHGETAGNTLVFSNLKLEWGDAPTDWTPAPEDTVLSKQDGESMSWRLLSDKCIWWNNEDGTNSETSPLMRLDGGGLYIKGTVDAEYGNIGGWAINPVCLASEDQTVGMSGTARYSFWAGNSNPTNAPFSVQKDGVIKAESGTIGGWKIGATSISNEGITLSTNGAVVPSLVTDGEASPECLTVSNTQMYEYACNNGNFLTLNITKFTYTFTCGISNVGYISVSPRTHTQGGGTVVIDSWTSSGTSVTITGHITYPTNTDVQEDDYVFLHLLYSSVAPTFQLLEDGSLYATDAAISGHIHATSGNFKGEIEASGGTIGGLVVQKDGLSFANDDGLGIALLTNGDISAQNVMANDLYVQKIRSSSREDVFLNFMSSSPTYETVKLTRSTPNIISKGKQNLFGIIEEGEVQLTLTAKPALTRPQALSVHVQYGSFLYGVKVTHTQIWMSNTDTLTMSVPYLVANGGGTESFEGFYLDGYEFEQLAGGFSHDLACSTNFVPSTKETFTLGLSNGQQWKAVYALNVGNGSDRKIKDNIADLSTDFSEQLINGLSPKSYIFKSSATPRTRYGFIAQDVEELLHSLGTSADEVGLVCKSLPGEPDSENNHYSLNYINLIAPMVSVIQQLSRRVAELEDKLYTEQND